jgi:hypothetical protein
MNEVADYRWIYPLPLVDVSMGVVLPIENFPKEELVELMIEDDRFKLLFEHCFPLQKILSIMTIYTEVVFSSAGSGNLIYTFDQVKGILKSIFEGSKNMNNYSYRDKNTQSAGGNAGLHTGRPRRVFSDGRARVYYDNESSSFVNDNETDRRP